MDTERIRIGNIDLDVIGRNAEQVQLMHRAEDRLNQLIKDKLTTFEKIENAEQAVAILNDLYDIPKEAGLLARKLYTLRLPAVCLYYEAQSGAPVYPAFDRHVFAGASRDAARLAADTAAALAGMGHWLQGKGVSMSEAALLLPGAKEWDVAEREARLESQLA